MDFQGGRRIGKAVVRGGLFASLALMIACGPAGCGPKSQTGAPGTPAASGALTKAMDDWKNDLQAGLQAQQQNNFPESERLLLSALEKARAIKGQNELVADSLYNLGRCYYYQDRLEEAMPYYQEAIDVIQKTEGDSSARYAMPANDLSLIYMKKQQYAKAEPILVKILALWEKSLGKDHPSVASGLNNLGGLYKLQGRYDEAEAHYRRSLEIKLKRLGRENTAVSQGYMNLARLYEAKGDFERAEPFFRESVMLAEKAKDAGPDSPFTSNMRKTYAAMLKALNRPEEAIKLDKGETIAQIYSNATTWLPDSETSVTLTMAAVPLTTATLQSVVTRSMDYGDTEPAAVKPSAP